MPSMFKMKLRVGSYTGNQSFSTWLKNESARMLKETERRMFRAAGFCRKDMKNGMARARQPKTGYKGYNWASYPPSTPPKAPKKRAKGKAGLQYVTFKQVKRFEFRVGPDMNVKFGKNTKFAGDKVHAMGGNNKQVKLPMDIEHLRAMDKQDGSNFAGKSIRGQIKWPMTYKKCHYRKRDFLSAPAEKTQKRFRYLFANLNTKG